MTGEDWVGLVVTGALLVYLFFALIRADRTR
ncbi:K(+)-transporting ATPase subunit F [Pengzhenrongella sicca]|uniref:K(+)-transporting ATPase subunit F n=1 Tax=Pengzhenrongella sicca TaxID=2819238 RepID=A0A8A4ZEP1_9MICO|nr:K(+)-transporting ATPase subunit F [Pengzhenrongella sicca]